MKKTGEKKEEKGVHCPIPAVFVSGGNEPYELIAERFAQALLRRLSGQR